MATKTAKTPKFSERQRSMMAAALGAAVSYFGSQGKLADAVGIKQPSIAGAILRGKVSEAIAKLIHDKTRGEIPKWKLRPDKFENAGGK